MTQYCETCRYYNAQSKDEYAGPVGQCRINPPAYQYREFNSFPLVKAGAWCGQWKGRN